MLKHIVAVLFLVCAGCSTPDGTSRPHDLTDMAEQLTLKVEPAPLQGVTVDLILSRPGVKKEAAWMADENVRDSLSPRDAGLLKEYGEIVAAPRITIRPGEPGVVRMGTEIAGYTSSTSYRVGGRMVKTDCPSGLSVTLYAAPAEDKKVHIYGVMALSGFRADGASEVRTFPIDVTVSMHQAVVVYRRESYWGGE